MLHYSAHGDASRQAQPPNLHVKRSRAAQAENGTHLQHESAPKVLVVGKAVRRPRRHAEAHEIERAALLQHAADQLVIERTEVAKADVAHACSGAAAAANASKAYGLDACGVAHAMPRCYAWLPALLWRRGVVLSGGRGRR